MTLSFFSLVSWLSSSSSVHEKIVAQYLRVVKLDVKLFNMNLKKNSFVALRLPEETLRLIDARGRELYLNRSDVIRDAITAYLAPEEK